MVDKNFYLEIHRAFQKIIENDSLYEMLVESVEDDADDDLTDEELNSLSEQTRVFCRKVYLKST